MRSVWRETELPAFPQLKEDVRTDVLIIGGGIAGILTAYFLDQQGVDYLLAEKGRLCSGTTGNTTGKLTVQHGLVYQKLLKRFGEEKTREYLWANQAALAEYARLCPGLDCDYETKDNYIYAVSDREKLEVELTALEKVGCEAQFCEDLPIPLSTVGAVMVPNQAQFNPLKFLAALSKGLRIYENTFVREMIGTTAVTDCGKIEARRVVCATHFPFVNKHGGYFLKLYQHRSYLLALENAQKLDGMYVDENHAGMTFRSYGEYLILGGNGSRTGKKGRGWEPLRTFAGKHYPQAQERYFWAAQDCMSLDDVPYIGHYSKSTPNFYVASGFNKWGLTGAMVSALVLCDLLTGKSEGFAEIFNPSRSILRPQLLVNGFEAAKNLLNPSTRRCPHLGCALKWNPAERSWDCPCHGSRFAETGAVLDNPANGDLGPRELEE